MRLWLPFILIITLFSTCKKRPPISENGSKTIPEYKWNRVPSSEIYLGDRVVLAMNTFDSLFYIQTENLFYVLDTNFILKKAYGSGPKHKNDFLTFPKISQTHTIFSDKLAFWIKDNKSPVNQAYSPFLHIYRYDQKAVEMLYTAVKDNGIFQTLHASRHTPDSVSYHINTYKMLVPFTASPPVELLSTFGINTYKDLNPTLYGMHLFNGVSFCSIQGFTYRIENDVLTDTLKYDLRQIVEKDGLLYATSQWVVYRNPTIHRGHGLVVSKDKGKSWSYIATGSSFAHGYLRSINDKLFIFTGNWVAHVDLTSGLVKKLNTERLDAYIRDIAKVGSKIAIGTDAGVYYMDWNKFLSSY